MNNGGKPPKTGSQIRSKLESISKTAAVARHAGPVNDQNKEFQQITVGSFFDQQLGRTFQKELTRVGIFSESVVRARKLVITVDNADFQTASAMCAEFRDLHPDRRPNRDSARYDYLLFGTVIGFSLAMIFIMDTQGRTANIALGLSITGFFAASGHLLDRARAGKIRFGLWDMFVLVAIGGTVFGMISSLPLFPH